MQLCTVVTILAVVVVVVVVVVVEVARTIVKTLRARARTEAVAVEAAILQRSYIFIQLLFKQPSNPQTQ